MRTSVLIHRINISSINRPNALIQNSRQWEEPEESNFEPFVGASREVEFAEDMGNAVVEVGGDTEGWRILGNSSPAITTLPPLVVNSRAKSVA